MSYSEKLKDPRWQKKRLEIMQRDGFACKQCGDETSTLNVHHRYYIRGREPWQYPGACLITLCETCHSKEGAFYEGEFFNWEKCLDLLTVKGFAVFGNLRGEDYRDIYNDFDRNALFRILVDLSMRANESGYPEERKEAVAS